MGKLWILLYQSGILMDDTHAYIFMDCEGGNDVSAIGVGANEPLVTVDLGW